MARSTGDFLVLLSVLTLPFTASLTLPLRFPLKIYEVAIAGAVLIRFVLQGTRVDWRALTAPLLLLGALAGAATFSLVYAVNVHARPGEGHLYRYGAVADGVLQIAYLVVAVAAMVLVWELACRRREDVLRYWSWGALAASFYALYLVAGDLLHLTLPELPGTSSQVGYLSGQVVHRAGTFLEGNFFGVYLFLSIAVALIAQRPRAAVGMSAALLFTLSPLSIAAGGCLWLLYALRGGLKGRWPVSVLVGWPLFLAALAGPGLTFGDNVTQKLREPSSQSVVERSGTAAAALSMFEDHPISGVGIGQYSLWFTHYRPSSVPDYYLVGDVRFIPNNVYAQVAAETGALGIIPLLAFVVLLLRRAFRTKSTVMAAAALMLALLLNTFPSPTTVFVWAFFGLVLAAKPGVPPAHHDQQ